MTMGQINSFSDRKCKHQRWGGCARAGTCWLRVPDLLWPCSQWDPNKADELCD